MKWPNVLVRARRTLADIAPAPMAAPETPALRRARLMIMAALFTLAAICLAWGWVGGVAGSLLIALVAGISVFLVIQVPLWICAKNRADDAWLSRETTDA